MRRRTILKAAGLATVTVPLAGCGGSDGETGDDGAGATDSSDDESGGNGDGTGSENTPTPGADTSDCTTVDAPLTGEVTGVPDALELVETEASRSGISVAASGVQVEMTFRVVGDSTVELDSYGYDLTVYDADDNVLSDGDGLGYQNTIEPGNTGSVFVNPVPSLDCPGEAARYEVRITG